jgi:two-component system phosphate regulon sensor histidine kinase PhoR
MKDKNQLTPNELLKAEKRDFFVNASHELNTPLSSIIGYTEIIKKEQKFIPEFIDTILAQATRMKALLVDMMRLAEMDEEKGFNNTKFCLATLGKEVVDMLMVRAENKLITLYHDLAPVQIVADRSKINEMLENLIDNAIKYSDPGGTVLLSIQPDGDKACIRIKDNGQGIAEQHLGRIFERFYRPDGGRARTGGGTGLGLAIVKHICKYYDASLVVNSTLDIGTEFIIHFEKAV